jgi:hypothetical protein
MQFYSQFTRFFPCPFAILQTTNRGCPMSVIPQLIVFSYWGEGTFLS